MANTKRSKHNPQRRPDGDKTVVTCAEIDDIVHLLLTSAQLTRGESLSEHDIKATARAVASLVHRMRPYYRSRRDMPHDVALPLLYGDERKSRISDIIKSVKKLAAQWKRSTPNIFTKQ